MITMAKVAEYVTIPATLLGDTEFFSGGEDE